MMELRGISVSPGIAIGKAFVYQEEKYSIPRYDIDAPQVPYEYGRFLDAARKAGDEVRAIRALGEDRRDGLENGLLDALEMMLADPEFHGMVEKNLEEKHKNVEWVLLSVVETLTERLDVAGNEYLKERSADIQDVGRRIMDNLLYRERTSLSSLREPVILVTHNLMPSDALSLDRRFILGIAMDAGGRTSHSAILARSAEIPAVLGLSEVTQQARPGIKIIVDANRGTVIVDPDEETIRLYGGRRDEWEHRTVLLRELGGLPAETRDGKLVRLEANIEVPTEIDSVISHGADGVGLFRSEFLFLRPTGAPSEEEQYQAYRSVLQAMKGKPVTIRTLDLGGDKVVPGYKLEYEGNPILGWRAIRFCLARPDIFRTQLRALLRASMDGNLRIMFPLISGSGELDRILSMVEEARGELRQADVPFREDIPMGIMIEVPSAAITSDLLAEKSDFFSIGTNDLIQYVLAVDRGNEKVAYLYDPFHPAVLRLIRTVIENAHRHGVMAGMCGEMAGDPLAAVVLLGLGLDSFSMSAIGIPLIKKIVRSADMMEAERFARSLLQLGSGEEIGLRVRGWMEERFDFLAS